MNYDNYWELKQKIRQELNTAQAMYTFVKINDRLTKYLQLIAKRHIKETYINQRIVLHRVMG